MNDLISVIIPVYNTGAFLSECLETLISQTYTNLEIILINDGSTDNSFIICNEYVKKDSRIILYSKENEGQGKARNLGIKKCRGKYVMFVDADDWLDKNLIYTLYTNMNKTNSNIAVCNYYKTYLNEYSQFYKVEEKIDDGQTVVLSENKKMLNNISTYPWGKLYRKCIFEDNKIEFPGHFFEDVAIMPLVYALANSISFVSKPLYFYRNRSGNTTNSITFLDDRIKCIETLIHDFYKYGLYDVYQVQLKYCLEQRMQINIRMARNALDVRFKEFVEKQEQVIKGYFTDLKCDCSEIMVIGSYNLMIVAKIVMNYENDKRLNYYFGRASLISIMSDGRSINKNEVYHENRMKCNCLVNDFSKKLQFFNKSELKGVKYVFIDLLEERYDIGRYQSEYFTISDAFLDIEKTLQLHYEKIVTFSDEWYELWKKNCKQFLSLLLQYVKPWQIIILRSTLTEKYIQDNKEYFFPELNSIKTCNRRLEECYDYIVDLNPEIKDIPISNLQYYKTSADFRHGCYPWHLGNMAYQYLGEYIKDILNEYEKF